jgi:glutamyl/glutaminyl-tRNA synthetase
LRAWLAPVLPEKRDEAELQKFCEAIRHNVFLPKEAAHWVLVVFGQLPACDDVALSAIKGAGDSFFAKAIEVFASATEFREAAKSVSQATGRKGPDLYMPLRAALTAVTHGPELAPLFAMMPRDEVTRRLEAARVLAGRKT